MKHLATVLILALGLIGCASATPIDFLIPTRQLPESERFLAEALPPSCFLYHNLADTKIEKKLMRARLEVYKGQYELARVGNEAVIAFAEPLSNLAWGGILAALAAAGIMVPKPGTTAKIKQAGAMPPDQFKETGIK